MGDSEKNLSKIIASMEQQMSSDPTTSTVNHPSTATMSTQSPAVPQEDYPAPNISTGPARYQHVRMFSDLLSAVCPMIQSSDKNPFEAAHMKIEVLNNNDTSKGFLFLSEGPREG